MMALLRVNVGSDGDVAEVNSKLRVPLAASSFSEKFAVRVPAPSVAAELLTMTSARPLLLVSFVAAESSPKLVEKAISLPLRLLPPCLR